MSLKGISPLISPDLLRILALMGHGEECVLADAYFPGASISSKNSVEYVRADGIQIPGLLEGILELIDLDTYVDSPVAVMDTTEQDKKKGLQVPIWDFYLKVLEKSTKKPMAMSYVERFDFYERAKKAFVIVQTGEKSIYGNIILKKGVTGKS